MAASTTTNTSTSTSTRSTTASNTSATDSFTISTAATSVSSATSSRFYPAPRVQACCGLDARKRKRPSTKNVARDMADADIAEDLSVHLRIAEMAGEGHAYLDTEQLEAILLWQETAMCATTSRLPRSRRGMGLC